MNIQNINQISTLFFGLAILHTFSVKFFQSLALKYPEGSVLENLFHLLGEVEVIFGLWSAAFFATIFFTNTKVTAFGIIENQNYTEPIFIFIIMVIASTKPILDMAQVLFSILSRILPLNAQVSKYLVVMILGPLLGSLITEPAAMTVTALVLRDQFFSSRTSEKFKYATIGLLFVSVSIGGTLTNFAAPPILMVAGKWAWSTGFVFSKYGVPAMVSIVLSSLLVVFRFKDELVSLQNEKAPQAQASPLWVSLTHLVFLMLSVLTSHHPAICIFVFLFFVGFATISKEYQEDLKIKEGLLVSFFLGGLVILGSYQSWWLEPILLKLNSLSLFLGVIGLTAITDNAALTYLGSQVQGLSEVAKLALVGGSVVGGGLTVIANAPNPIGYGLLGPSFGAEGVSSLGLFKSALIPTAIAGCLFWVWL